MDPFVVTLRRVRRRLSIQHWMRLNSKFFLVVLAACCLWLLITKCFPVLGDPLLVCLGLIVAGVVAATALAFLSSPTLLGTALEADGRLGLKERLTSSYELAGAEGAMIEALHIDARRHLKRIDPRRDFRYRAPRSARWLGIPLLIFGLGYTFLPEFDLLHQREREAEAKARQEAIRVKAEKLKLAVRPLRKPPNDEAGGLAKVAESVERVAEDLQSHQISEKQALARLKNLSSELRKRREQLGKDTAIPKLPTKANELGLAREVASAIQKGRLGEAAERLRQLQKKFREGTLSKKELGQLSKEMQQLADMLGGKDSKLGEALAEAMQGLEAADLESALAQLKAAELSLEDIASLLEQIEKIDAAMIQLAKWEQDILGPSEFCRICGVTLKECEHGGGCTGCGPGFSCYGVCAACAGIGGAFARGEGGIGPGMRGPGRGRGGLVGDLPDVNVGLKPAVLPGAMTKGRALASIMQRGAPEEEAESELEYVAGAFVEVRQEAEQALEKEEIPPGAKEFVRQYFGSIEPESARLSVDGEGTR